MKFKTTILSLLFGLTAHAGINISIPPISVSEVAAVNEIAGDDFNFEKTIGSWTTYDDSGDPPTDCTGGSPAAGVTATRITSGALVGNGSGRMTKDAADRLGHGYSMDFTTNGVKGLHAVKFKYKASAALGLGDASDVQVYAYDISNATLQNLGFISLREAEGTYIGGFDNTTGGAAYRICLHITSTNASAWTLDIDQVSFGLENQTATVDGTASGATRLNQAAVASGGSAVAGGNSIASGTVASAFGFGTTSAGFGTTTFGGSATSTQDMELVHASGQLAAAGDVQTIIQHIAKDVDTTGPLQILFGGVDITLADETAYGFIIKATCIQTTGAGDGDTAYWEHSGLVKRVGGGAVLVGGSGAQSPTYNDAGSSGWTLTLGVSSNDMTITMAGMPGGTNVRCSGTVIIAKSNG